MRNGALAVASRERAAAMDPPMLRRRDAVADRSAAVLALYDRGPLTALAGLAANRPGLATRPVAHHPSLGEES